MYYYTNMKSDKPYDISKISTNKMARSHSDFKFMSSAAIEEQKRLEKLKYKQVNKILPINLLF